MKNFNFNAVVDDVTVNQDVRVVDIEGKPWFVLKDVCAALGLKNPTEVAQRVYEEDKSKTVLGKGRPAISVSESGMYRILMRCDKPAARPFQDWVTREVLPSIRRTGKYEMEEGETIPLPANFAQAMRQHAETLIKLADSEEERERLLKETERLGKKSDILDAHYAPLNNISVGRFARTLDGVNSNKMKQSLMKLGYLYNKAGVYRVYSQYLDKLFSEKRNEEYGTIEIFATDTGRERIVHHWNEGELILKKGFEQPDAYYNHVPKFLTVGLESKHG
ncbi:Bro-N domain-containing protein [Curvivirga sp.]|uniref:BRO-N domain-containing protein n=1 Tax=Curvivirga sp. TaxID=2856848 RepID=UPI003B5B534C